VFVKVFGWNLRFFHNSLEFAVHCSPFAVADPRI
jgi:hypothetical protein